MTQGETNTNQSFHSTQRAILFADLVASSILDEAKKAELLTKLWPEAKSLLDEHSSSGKNTWGDGFVAFFSDIHNGANCALALRRLFRDSERTFEIRIGLHYGSIWRGYDTIREKDGYLGHQIDFAARVEPLTPPNEILVTEDACAAGLRDSGTISLHDAGKHSLPKTQGEHQLWLMLEAREELDANAIKSLGRSSFQRRATTSKEGLADNPAASAKDSAEDTGARLSADLMEAIKFFTGEGVRIDGAWASRIDFPDEKYNIHTMILRQSGCYVDGDIQCTEGYSKGNRYKFFGTLRDSILTGIYQIADPTKIERGALALRAINDARVL